MQTPIIMTIISPDRTGLVESIARTIAEHGGNWLESRMCRLGGKFAGILRIEIPEGKKSVLLAALQKLQTNGLHVLLQDGEGQPGIAGGKQIKLEIVGGDRPGIVREITAALARAAVNVEEFASEVVSAPMTGQTLFKATSRLQLPTNCDLALLKNNLEKIAGDLQVDVTLAEVK
jgi:glycine cleavage system regulatory protein